MGRRGGDRHPGGEDSTQGNGWRTGVGKTAAGQQGSSWQIQQQTVQPRALAQGNKASNLWLNTPVGVEAAAGETPSLTGEFVGETHRVPEGIQTHTPRNQHQKGPICLLVAGEVIEIWQRADQAALFPLGPSPIYSVIMQWRGLPRPGEHLRLRPFM